MYSVKKEMLRSEHIFSVTLKFNTIYIITLKSNIIYRIRYNVGLNHYNLIYSVIVGF